MGWFSSWFGKPKPVEDEGCLACGNADVEILGEDAYRCSACGHEGGDGLARVKLLQLGKQLAAKPLEERRAWPAQEIRDLCQLYAAVPTHEDLKRARERDRSVSDPALRELPVLLQDMENVLDQAFPKIDRLVMMGRAAGSDIPGLEEALARVTLLPRDVDSAEIHARLREVEEILGAVAV